MCCICSPWLERTSPYSPGVHTALPSRTPDQPAQVCWESFLSKGYSKEKQVYREPGCELIAPTAGPYSWYSHTWWSARATCGWGGLFPSKDVPVGGWGGVGNVQQIYTSVRGFSGSPPLFLVPCSLLGYIPCPPLCKSLPWLTVQ